MIHRWEVSIELTVIFATNRKLVVLHHNLPVMFSRSLYAPSNMLDVCIPRTDIERTEALEMIFSGKSCLTDISWSQFGKSHFGSSQVAPSILANLANPISSRDLPAHPTSRTRRNQEHSSTSTMFKKEWVNLVSVPGTFSHVFWSCICLSKRKILRIIVLVQEEPAIIAPQASDWGFQAPLNIKQKIW